MLPEINFAKRLIERHALVPPVDVFELTKHYAHVEHTAIPFDIDGVSLNLKVQGHRPHVIVNTKYPRSRQRFTLAHELGHVIIPWHVGSIIDSTEDGLHTTADGYWAIESEANRFAAELLMPSSWLQSILAGTGSAADIHGLVTEIADVSPASAAVKLIQELPAGYVFCALEGGTVVRFAGRSAGTIANAPQWRAAIDIDAAYEYAEERWHMVLNGQDFVWWKLPTSLPLPATEDKRAWRDILNEILDQLYSNQEARNRIRQQVNGVLGYAYSTSKLAGTVTQEAVYSAAMQCLSSSSEFKPLLSHSSFSAFLSRRISELCKTAG